MYICYHIVVVTCIVDLLCRNKSIKTVFSRRGPYNIHNFKKRSVRANYSMCADYVEYGISMIKCNIILTMLPLYCPLYVQIKNQCRIVFLCFIM